MTNRPTSTPARTTNDGLPDGERDDDRGTILVLTLLLTVVLAVIVLSLATYAATGLSTSRVTTERTESNAVAAAGMNWALEELSAKRFAAESDCDTTWPVPDGVLPSAADAISDITCTSVTNIDDHPTLQLDAVATGAGGTDRRIEVVVQVPRDQYTVQVASWEVD